MCTWSPLSPSEATRYTSNFARIPYVRSDIDKQRRLISSESLVTEQELATRAYQIYLCHVTSVLPENGIILARVNVPLALLKVPSNNFVRVGQLFQQMMSITRPTVHFAVNGVMSHHSDYRSGVEDKDRIVIMERLANVAISGGYGEDLFCIGSHKLSNEATVILPYYYLFYKDLQAQLRQWPVSPVIYYRGGNETVNAAVDRVLREKRIIPLHPNRFLREANPDTPFFFLEGDDGKVLSSEVLLRFLRRPLCTHDITAMTQIEDLIVRNGITTKPRFLNVLKSCSPEGLKALVEEYIDSIRETISLNEEQKVFLEEYKMTLLSLFKMMRDSGSIEELTQKWNLDRELYQYYDHPIDLSREVPNQLTAEALKRRFGLDFKAYQRLGCETIADAAYCLPEGVDGGEFTARLQLQQISSSIQTHQEKQYLVVKGVNLTEVANRIYS